MRLRPKRTDVVEAAANAVIDALTKGIEDHHRMIEEIRRELQDKGDRRG